MKISEKRERIHALLEESDAIKNEIAENKTAYIKRGFELEKRLLKNTDELKRILAEPDEED